MFLRCKVRRKDGKQHRYWSVVENTRVAGGRVAQRHVLYLGEINDTQELAWRRSIAVLEDGAVQPRTLSLFPEDRCEGLLGDASVVRVKLSELRLRRPRQWGACWLALLCGASCSWISSGRSGWGRSADRHAINPLIFWRKRFMLTSLICMAGLQRFASNCGS
jgi:hypothetical protein